MNNRLGLFETDIEKIISVLEKQSKINEAIIFGSRAKGNFKNGSDIDIALKGNGLDLNNINQISYYLNEETTMPYKFDILNYHSITEPSLKEHIDRVGVKIFTKKELISII